MISSFEHQKVGSSTFTITPSSIYPSIAAFPFFFVTRYAVDRHLLELPQSVKSQGKTKFIRDQGRVSDFCILVKQIWNSAQSQGNLYYFGYFKVFLTFIEQINEKTEKYVQHAMFSVQIAMFKVSEICSRSEKSQGIFLISMCGNPVYIGLTSGLTLRSIRGTIEPKHNWDDKQLFCFFLDGFGVGIHFAGLLIF